MLCKINIDLISPKVKKSDDIVFFYRPPCFLRYQHQPSKHPYQSTTDHSADLHKCSWSADTVFSVYPSPAERTEAQVSV